MADAGTLNPAVKANLEKVLAEEQRRAALRMAQIRFLLSVIAGVIVLTPSQRSDPSLAPTVYGTLAFLCVSALVYAVTRFVPSVGKWGTLAVAFVDVPMLAFIQHLQAERLPMAWYGIPTAVALPCGLVALSALSLSRTVITLTALMATATILRRLVSLDLPTPPILLTMLIPGAIGLVAVTVVGRIRALVHAARKKDLVGKYILGERLGAGGMAEVFLATYSPEGGFERKVAVKRILPSYAERPESIALFRREAELGAGLAHPNVVQVLDFGADGDTWFIAMEFVDGLPLSRVLAFARKAGTPLPLPACVYLIEELCQALDYIHTRTSPTGSALQLIHRDVNPPNVLVSRIGEVKLNDFGVARAAGKEQLTEAGMLRGKVAYAAPEQLLGQPYDARADLWALGVTAFEVLVLQKPFTAPDDVALYRACLEAPLPVPRELRADLPEGVEEIVLGLLVRDPGARFQTAEQVLERLDALDPALTDRVLGRKQLATWVNDVRKTMSDEAAFSPTPSANVPDGQTATMTHDLRTTRSRKPDGS
ncbi:MAG: serine/threonine-protein kinase [Myxococcales bacterium]|nr:serine/threonine-protein kinase [Myxococcales bacterium]